MGGRPLTALNVVAFPARALPPEVLTQIIQGGLDKIHEAGCLLVGGHTIDDEELKYGLSVTGIIHPAKLLTNSGAQAGDRLILTKPLGTGIITTAHKGGVASSRTLANAVDSMRCLNRRASEIAVEAGAHAAVDITGFGLLGHSSSMAQASGVTLVFEADRIPLMEGVEEYAAEGLVPGGADKNREYYTKGVQFRRKIPPDLELILFDPQTSGGLLIAAPASQAQRMVEKLQAAGIEVATSVGEVHPKGKVSVEIV
jgi:selenide,water dikinase